MLLDRQTNPINPKAIKAVRKQIDEIVTMADEYRDFAMLHMVGFSDGLGNGLDFTMDIEPSTDEGIDTFEFETSRKPDKKFMDHTSSFFDISKVDSEHGEFWKISMNKEQFSNSKLIDELLNWFFEDWKNIKLLFVSEEDLDEFEEMFEVFLPYIVISGEEEEKPIAKSGGKKAAAAAATTGFVVAYTEEEVSYADDDDSGFEFPEFF
jgi:hypothetical protein